MTHDTLISYVMEMRYNKGMTIEAIAKDLNVSEPRVKLILNYVKQEYPKNNHRCNNYKDFKTMLANGRQMLGIMYYAHYKTPEGDREVGVYNVLDTTCLIVWNDLNEEGVFTGYSAEVPIDKIKRIDNKVIINY